ncbi:MAG: hypothetical protein GTN51_12550 [Armatimonadetes bacterium]|nr:hypothetical protein [Armatimonadota bacterium]
MSVVSSQIKADLFGKGASLVGFADLVQIPSDVRDSMRFAVSIAAALDPIIVAEIHDGPTKEYHAEYRRANALLWELAQYASSLIEDLGCRAIPRKPTHAGIDSTTQSTLLPHKTVATRAGLESRMDRQMRSSGD